MSLRDASADGVGDSEPSTPPPLDESARAVYASARGLAGAWGGRFIALRHLLAADLALAKAALAHGAIWLAVAATLLATGWTLLTVLAIWGLHSAGLGWGWAIAIPMLVAFVIAAVAIWRGLALLQLADLAASRRELMRWWSANADSTASSPSRENDSR